MCAAPACSASALHQEALNDGCTCTWSPTSLAPGPTAGLASGLSPSRSFASGATTARKACSRAP
eukprot:CAMPEP_0119504074 /NCGR_PEP_ID=MMETSP1344-20130328/25042_1 /TAXON_ID=236787 /ORGANISM="Florenciella parvula, Strain CCMP2471" /LENGTH=63 /DNA_ID=CAMNT_0007540415 /DNA_START=73 /DNA_END=262 /DNA_ORIENTATION=-